MKIIELLKERTVSEDKVAQLKAQLKAEEAKLAVYNDVLENQEVKVEGISKDSPEVRDEPEPEVETSEPEVEASEPEAPEPSAKKEKKAKAKAPKAKKTAKAKATVSKSNKTVTDESRKNASEGRKAVACGDRPPLRKAIVLVMGTKVLKAAEVVSALEAREWLPSSGNIKQYISYMLSSNCPKVFERTERRGYYRVRPGYKTDDSEAKTNEGTEVEADPKVDEVLKDAYGDILEGNVEENPFGDLSDSSV